MNKKTTYTPAQVEYIRQHYATGNTLDIALHLGLTEGAVYRQAYILGLKKNKSVLSYNGSQVAMTDAAKSNRFKKGQSAWNKGMKGLHTGGEAGYFKKGGLPANTKADGAISIRKNGSRTEQFIRIRLGVWVTLARYRYEQAYGAIPAGHCLMYIDGNSMNAELSNLKVITQRENRMRNTGWARMDDRYVAKKLTQKGHQIDAEAAQSVIDTTPELIRLKRAQLLLNRQIKQVQHEQQNS